MYRSLFLLIIICLFQVANAKTLTKEAIAHVVPMFAGYKGLTYDAVKSVEPFSVDERPAFYVVNLTPQGWMLIAADNKVSPVLAYSHQGQFVTRDFPVSLELWLNNYARMVFYISETKELPEHPNWNEQPLRAPSAVTDDAVEPLIKVKFNQSSPWNKYCPSDNNGRAVVGCVAVAMAQAMTVHKYPERPTGSFSYSCPPYGNLFINYSAEPAYNWDMIIAGTDGKDASAKLLYHCGVSVEMEYSPSGSGTQTGKITGALKSFFYYPNSVKTYTRGSYTDDWESLIKNEIKHGRPVVYAGNDGTSNPGHAFNLDGYDGNNMYHINWGWGGANNGYYGINNIKDGQNDYTKGQQVITGIRPPSIAPSDIFISNLSVPANQPAGTVVGTVTVESEAVNPIYEYQLKGPYSIFLHDYMPASFYIEKGELKTVRPFDLEDEQIPVSITVTNKNNGLSYEKDFIIRIADAPNSVEKLWSNNTGLNFVYTEKKLIVYAVDKETKFDIYNMSGRKVRSGLLSQGTNKIDLSDIQEGYYLFKTPNTFIKPVKLLVH